MHYQKKSFLKSSKKNSESIFGNIEVNFGINRILVFKVFLLFIFMVIAGRLFFMQIIKYNDYKVEASQYQDMIEKIPAKRGEIYVISDKNVDLKSIKTYNASNIDKLDKIAVNVYKYNIIFNPRMLYNYGKMSDEMFNILGNSTVVEKAEIENKLVLLNNPDTTTDKLLEILYPDLYKLKDQELKLKTLSDQKTETEQKIKITKNQKTKKTLEDSLFGINMALKIDDETKKNLDLLKTAREDIYSKITKENNGYEVIKKDIEEDQMQKISSYFQDLYYSTFSAYISSLNSQTKESQIKNFYKNFLTFEKNESRLYVDSNIFSQITGFLKIKEKETTLQDGSIKSDKYGEGVYGVEGYFDKDLKGIDGKITGKYDSSGKLIATADRSVQEAKNGTSLVLTIDKSIQYDVCKELDDAVKLYQAEGGSILVMNPKTGDVLAMCNNPTFDANKYGQVSDMSLYNNPIVSDQVEFGSVMKVMTMSAGIDLGVINAYSTYEDTGCAKIGDWKKPICNADNSTVGAHGVTGMVDVLDKSLNLGAYYVASKVGKDNFKTYVNNFGFGQKTGIELGAEAKGDMRNLDKMGGTGGDIYLATASFGQGVTMTQIQYLTAFSSVINGGKLMKPHIVKATIDDNGVIKENEPQLIRNTIKPETSSTMRGMLVSVIEKGYDKISQVKGHYVGGKTGTAQFAEEGKYGDKTTQSFVGFGPVDDPKFAILIKLKNPKTEYASYSCTPVFSKIAKYLFDYYQIPPDKKD